MARGRERAWHLAEAACRIDIGMEAGDWVENLVEREFSARVRDSIQG